MGWGSEFPEFSEASRHVSVQNTRLALQIRHAGTKFSVVLRKPWRDVSLLCVFSCILRAPLLSQSRFFNNAGPPIVQYVLIWCGGTNS